MAEPNKYSTDITPYVNRATGLAIHKAEDVEVARDCIREIKGQIRAVKEFFDPRIDQAHALHKGLISDRAVFETPLKQAQSAIEGKIGTYTTAEQVRLRAETQRREEEARKEHEKIVARAAKKVEAILEKAGGVKEQIEALEVELERPDITEEESFAAASRLGVARGLLDASEQKAAIVTEQATRAYVPPPPPVAEKVAGVTVKTVKIPVILNEALLISAIAQGTAPIDIVDFNMTKIGKLINAGIKLPGVGHTNSHKTSVR